MHYLIVGGGPAGLNAAATLQRIDKNSRVTILAKEKIPPYSKIALPYLITGAAEEKMLYLSVPPAVSVVLGEAAAEINPKKQELRTSSGKKYLYDKLLIATGATPLRPNIKGIRLPFVFTIRDIPDVRAIKKILKAKKTGRAVVAGAGPVGLELSYALHKLGFEITLVISSDRVFSTMLDGPASRLLEKKLIEKGVEVRKGEDITKIRRSGETFLRSGESRFCDVVIFGKGVTPTVEFLAGSGINIRQGILVNEHQETNIPGIFAAGDVAETRDIVFEDSRVNALWPIALEQGRVAAYNMASRPLAYEGSYARNALRVFDISMVAAGMTKDDAPEIHREEGPDFHHKIVLDHGVLKGFIFMGEVRNVGLYNDLLRRKVQVASFANSLLHGNYDYAQFMKMITKQ